MVRTKAPEMPHVGFHASERGIGPSEPQSRHVRPTWPRRGRREPTGGLHPVISYQAAHGLGTDGSRDGKKGKADSNYLVRYVAERETGRLGTKEPCSM